MEKKLNNFFDNITADEMSEFDDVLENIKDSSKISSKEQEKILSKTMRKAGFNMNSNIKHKAKKGWIIAIASAACVSLVAAGTFMGNFKRFFGGDTKPFESEILKTVKTVNNNDITLSVDGVVADDVQCYVVVSASAQNQNGKEIIKKLNYVEGYKMYQEQLEKLGNEEKAQKYVFDYKNIKFENGSKSNFNKDIEKFIDTGNEYSYQSDDNHFYSNFQFETADLDLSKPLVVTEVNSGLSISVDLKSYMVSKKLVPVNNDKNLDGVDITFSPIGVHFRADKDKVGDKKFDDVVSKLNSIDTNSITAVYKDGRKEEIYDVSGAVVFDEKNPKTKDLNTADAFTNNKIDMKYIDLIMSAEVDARAESLLVIDDIEKIQIDGVEYNIK